jgi:hypothetical protein
MSRITLHQLRAGTATGAAHLDLALALADWEAARGPSTTLTALRTAPASHTAAGTGATGRRAAEVRTPAVDGPGTTNRRRAARRRATVRG